MWSQFTQAHLFVAIIYHLSFILLILSLSFPADFPGRYAARKKQNDRRWYYQCAYFLQADKLSREKKNNSLCVKATNNQNLDLLTLTENCNVEFSVLLKIFYYTTNQPWIKWNIYTVTTGALPTYSLKLKDLKRFLPRIIHMKLQLHSQHFDIQLKWNQINLNEL